MPFKLLNSQKKDPEGTPVSPPHSAVVVGQPVAARVKGCRATLEIDNLEPKIKPDTSPECAEVEKQVNGIPKGMRKIMKKLTEP